jgi:glutathione synthase/RimK-type ligase-like ATP-grasp enzyme
MSGRVAILTPAAEGPWYQSRWREVLARMAAPLAAAGLRVEDRSWTQAGDLGDFDLVLPLLAWGYHRDADWSAQVREWEGQGVRLHNPASVLRWNADKTYLARLESKGAPVAPTLFVDRVEEEGLHQAAARFGTDRLVVKPQVSAGAFQTIRWSPGTPLDDGPDRAAMIQPYLPSIETSGEVSLIYLGGTFSHAIGKVPQPGDFRVQPEYDGVITAHTPLPDELQAAEAVLAATDENLLYARVDLVRDPAGNPVLMELELVEPDLYLGFDAEAPARFAQACAAIS